MTCGGNNFNDFPEKPSTSLLTTAGLLLSYATCNLGSTFSSLCERTMMRLACLPEQLVRISEQLIPMDTKRGFY